MFLSNIQVNTVVPLVPKVINTDNSEESIVREIKNIYAPKVILVNHEKRLTVDTTCANLAIKYNLVYISVY